jgi:hypothetical protein
VSFNAIKPGSKPTCDGGEDGPFRHVEMEGQK